MVRNVERYQCEERLTPTTRRHVLYIQVKREIVQATFDELGNNGPTNASITVPIFAHAVSNRDRAGLHARGIFIQWENEAPEGYKMDGRLWLPVLNANRWNRLGLHNGGSYLGKRFIIVGKRPEVVRT